MMTSWREAKGNQGNASAAHQAAHFRGRKPRRSFEVKPDDPAAGRVQAMKPLSDQACLGMVVRTGPALWASGNLQHSSPH